MTAGAEQVEADMQEQLSDHLHIRQEWVFLDSKPNSNVSHPTVKRYRSESLHVMPPENFTRQCEKVSIRIFTRIVGLESLLDTVVMSHFKSLTRSMSLRTIFVKTSFDGKF